MTNGDLLHCSFCGKSQQRVMKLIAGPGVYICDECIDLCNQIIVEEIGAEVPDPGIEAAARDAQDALARLRALARQSREKGPE